MAFPVMSAADVPTVQTRTSKTTPLRNAMEQLEIGQAIEVAYQEYAPEEGYLPTTINQVAGTLSKRSAVVKYSVRRKADGTGCYVIAGPKPDEAEVPKRGRKPKTAADAA